MKRNTLLLPALTLLAGFSMQANAEIMLGTAGNFAVLAGSTVTNTGPTVINGGDVGVSPGTAITGFQSVDGGPGVITAPYTTHTGADAVAVQAQVDLTTAYNASAALAPTQTLTGTDLGGLTLTPGVYFFASSAQLTGILHLNNTGDPNGQFVFQIGSTLTTASDSSVLMTDNSSMPGCNVFWQVGTSATLGTDTAFEGHILAHDSITMTTGATILDGSALARTAAVTLDTNSINNCVIPLPESSALGLGLLPLMLLGRRRLMRVQICLIP